MVIILPCQGRNTGSIPVTRSRLKLFMDQPSAFQSAHPLSRKKIWKKMTDKSPWFFIVSVILGFAFWGVRLAYSPDGINTFDNILSLVVFLLLFFGTAAIFFAYFRLYIKRYYYDCDADFITIKKGVFTPREIHVQYRKIQDVYVDQDLLDRLFGIYDVHIASATSLSGASAHIDGVDKNVAEDIKNFLLQKIKGGDRTEVSSPVLAAEKNQTISFSGNVSSLSYPISGRWVAYSLITAFLYSLLIPALLVVGASDVFEDPQIGSFFTFERVIMIYVALVVLSLLAKILWLIIWKKNYHFEFFKDYILLRTSFISREEKHVPYKRVQDVSLHQNILERIFGIGTVIIENAAQVGANTASNVKLVGQKYDKAQELTAIIKKIINPIRESDL